MAGGKSDHNRSVDIVMPIYNVNPAHSVGGHAHKKKPRGEAGLNSRFGRRKLASRPRRIWGLFQLRPFLSGVRHGAIASPPKREDNTSQRAAEVEVARRRHPQCDCGATVRPGHQKESPPELIRMVHLVIAV